MYYNLIDELASTPNQRIAATMAGDTLMLTISDDVPATLRDGSRGYRRIARRPMTLTELDAQNALCALAIKGWQP